MFIFLLYFGKPASQPGEPTPRRKLQGRRIVRTPLNHGLRQHIGRAEVPLA